MVGLQGEVIKSGSGKMKIRVRGEIWNAVSDEDKIFETGTLVEVVQATGLVLKIVKIHDHKF